MPRARLTGPHDQTITKCPATATGLQPTAYRAASPRAVELKQTRVLARSARRPPHPLLLRTRHTVHRSRRQRRLSMLCRICSEGWARRATASTRRRRVGVSTFFARLRRAQTFSLLRLYTGHFCTHVQHACAPLALACCTHRRISPVPRNRLFRRALALRAFFCAAQIPRASIPPSPVGSANDVAVTSPDVTRCHGMSQGDRKRSR